MEEEKRKDKPFDDIEEEGAGEGAFAELFQESLRQLEVGRIVKGTVVQVTPDYVMVDVGYKSEGRVPVGQFKDENGQLTVGIGDEVEVLFERREDADGYLVLSKEKANRVQAWDRVTKAGGEGGAIEGKIVAKVKGGLTVDVGFPAFLPASQVDLRPVGNLDRFIGQTYSFRIVKVDRKKGSVVVSRRAILEEERERLKEETLAHLAEGTVLEGVVKNLTAYGAFVDLGGIDGLLHVTDMSWGRLGHPSELLTVGDKVRVMVLKYDKVKGKISLGLKQAMPDPWLGVEAKYPAGTRVRGKVVSLTDYGAFVALEEGVEGLIHVSEMSWTRRVKHPSALLKVGDEVEAAVLGVDVSNRRISLGLKQIEANPWTVIEEKYPVGTKIEGEVKNITDFGIFIGIEEGIDGLVHVSDMSWTKRVKHPSELFSKGDKVQAVVLSVDPEHERISLGIKQLTPDPWSIIPDKYKPGTRVKGKVTSVTDFGVFLEIEEGIEGLVHVSELAREKVESPKAVAAVGDELEAVVLNVDPVDRKIALSVKALQVAKEKAELAAYLGSEGEATSNLGKLLQKELKKNGGEGQ